MSVTTIYATIGNAISIYDVDTFAEAVEGDEGYVLIAASFGVRSTYTPLCFPDGTLVHTPNGLIEIEKVEKGDVVYSKNFTSNSIEPSIVTKVVKRFIPNLVRIYTSNGFVECSLDEPFTVLGKDWVKAAALKVGDLLITVNGTTKIADLKLIKGRRQVRNLIIERNHNYFVTSDLILIHNNGEPGTFRLDRGFLSFDSSSLGVSARVSAASLFPYFESSPLTEDDPGYAALHVVEGVFGDSLATTDFGAHRTKRTSGGSIAHGDITWDAYNEIVLNSTGIGWINKTGITKLCLRCYSDIEELEPTGTNRVAITSSEADGGSNPPYLSITYTATMGNIKINQRIFQHAERMMRFR